jgi:hypothetical protein
VRAALEIRTDLASPTELRRLARRQGSPRTATRMLAIANALDGMARAAAARLAGMERQALRNAVVRYNAEGLDGLRDRPKPGRPRALTGSRHRLERAGTAAGSGVPWPRAGRVRVAPFGLLRARHMSAAQTGTGPARPAHAPGGAVLLLPRGCWPGRNARGQFDQGSGCAGRCDGDAGGMRNIALCLPGACLALLLAGCAGLQGPAVPSVPAETATAADRTRAAALLREGLRAQSPPRGASPDPDRAAALIEQAAQLGDPDAQLLVATGHMVGPDRDPAAALPWLLRAAQQGNAEAQFRFARQIEAGDGAAREPAWAAVWFQRAAERGVAEAQFAFALLQIAGIGTAQDQAEALGRLRLAEQRGVASARRYREALEPRVPRADAAAALARLRGETARGPVVTPDRPLVRFAQVVLTPGQVDGRDGAATRAALLDFARREGIATANPYDQAVIDALRRRAPRS